MTAQVTAAGPRWPVFSDEVHGFTRGALSRPLKLFEAFTAKGTGSGRRPGPRNLYWQSVAAFSISALEAGLEDMVLAAHAVRQGSEGQVMSATNSLGKGTRRWLVEDRLVSPNPAKIERVLFTDFGVLLTGLPSEAQFDARKKAWARGGSGRGARFPGPSTWEGLSKYLETLNYVRNAAAHGDAAKFAKPPGTCEGTLWVRLEDLTWTVQQPHALTALRVVLATYNTVALAIADRLSLPAPAVASPNDIDFP